MNNDLISRKSLIEAMKKAEAHGLALGDEQSVMVAAAIAGMREFIVQMVPAVEVGDMREFAEDVAYQFGYYCQNGGRLHITHGGLSTLEHAFDILGWDNPHPVPECECEIDGCYEHATGGANTNDGYKRMCGRHYKERRIDNA